MKSTMLYRGMWHIPYAVQHALCEDGKRRYAAITGEPDTFFSIPARVQVKGKSVSGFITTDSDGDYQFKAYEYGVNGYLLTGVHPLYSVLVGNLGWVVQDEPDYRKALKVFYEYVRISQHDKNHRGYEEDVSLWSSTQGSPLDEYRGHLEHDSFSFEE